MIINEGHYGAGGAGVYGFRISVNTSDPYTRVTYPAKIHGQKNLAFGKTPASGTGADCMNGWAGCELISGIKRQKGYGSTWEDIANDAPWQAGDYGSDMMTYVPTWYMKMTNDGTNIDCAFSLKKIDSTWKDYAGSVGSNHVGHFRVGCFGGYVYDNTDTMSLLSLGNQIPTTRKSVTSFITYAKARGAGYDILTWYQWTYLSALAVLLYKSTDLQTAMAQGYVDGSSAQSESALVFSNDYGIAGGTSTTQQMAFFWIQNLWGNIYQFVGGAKTDSDIRLMTCTDYSSVMDADFDKTQLSPSLSSDRGGDINQVVGTTDAGFFPSVCFGSPSTYFSDYGYIQASYFPRVGGSYNSKSHAGPFLVDFGSHADNTAPHIGSRLSYRL